MTNSNNSLDLSKLYNISTLKQTTDTYNNSNIETYLNQQPENSIKSENISLENKSQESNKSIGYNNSYQEIPIMNRQQVKEQLSSNQIKQNNFNIMKPNNISGEILDFQNEYSMQNLNDLMRTQVGRNATVQFLIGNDNLVEKKGIILAVGDDYILLDEDGTDNILVCDFYNIRFVILNY